MSSFEMGLSRIVSNDMGISKLHPSPCVEGWYMNSLSNTESVNDLAWTQEGSYLDENLDGCSGYLDEMSNTWV